MTLRIVSIETVRSGRARRLLFDDATERTTSRAVVRELGLEANAEFADASDLEETLAPAERSCAHQRSLRALAQRDQTAAGLERRLAEEGYPVWISKEAVARLTEAGLLDDTRFAEAYVRTRVRQGFGRRRIADELAQRGVDPETIAEALASDYGEDDVDRALALLRGHMPSNRGERERAVRRLVSRGFDLAVALKAVDLETPAPDRFGDYTDNS
jgi:regulatory protein